MGDIQEQRDSALRMPAAIEVIQARRRLKLFRQLIIAMSTCVIAVVIVLMRLTDVINVDSRQLSPTIAIVTMASLAMLLIPTVQLGLEFPPKQWIVEYRGSRGIVDAQAAAERELEIERQTKRAERGYRPIDLLSYKAEREAFDQQENLKWASSNYGYLSRLAVQRMQAEIEHQGSRANTNLTIALTVAFVGVMILGWLAYDVSTFLSKPPVRSENQLLFYGGAFLGKVALAISANVFAFFFLSTYRRNLNEIRYFHNELTNFESRIIGTYIAVEGGVDKPIADSISGLIKTERNFILKRGETTADLSTKGLDRSETKDMISSLAALTKVLETKVGDAKEGITAAKRSGENEG